MAIINIKPGQRVFIIYEDKIFEAYIVQFINEKEMVVKGTSSYFHLKRTYGENLFFRQEKARKVLSSKLEEKKKLQEERELERLRLLEIKKREQELADLKKKAQTKKTICNSCGLPIGNFGHCGCSY